ncbi:uncharacterized protein LOC544848 isoform X3 [Mus musculus]|uniref:uncharacterized protein LOC544848 isoform X3 n=1 Tax=Mus musculus TaxID=10090 RepID=UPI001672C3B1|nr:uncharacterized protein LOC544848 isoform X3 [Mus musculus]
MPDQISVSEFVAETLEDYKAPTASSFTTGTAQCRNTAAAIEEATLGKPIILKDIVKVREEMKAAGGVGVGLCVCLPFFCRQ